MGEETGGTTIVQEIRCDYPCCENEMYIRAHFFGFDIPLCREHYQLFSFVRSILEKMEIVKTSQHWWRK